MTYYTIGIFFFGVDIILLPVILILFLIGVLGLITIPVGLYRLIRKQSVNKWLTWIIGLAIGFYLGLILQKPIDNWNREQRNISGQIVTAELEKFKQENGQYPDSLTQLNIDDLNKSLPSTYHTHRFDYFTINGGYNLNIPIPIFDRWHWNKDKKEFEYDDF